MTKRKEERRELLKEDEILSGLERIARYIQEEPTKVFGWTAGIVLALALFFGYNAYQKSQAIDNAGDLYKAEKILGTNIDDEKSELKFDSNKAKFEAALVELDKVIASHSGMVADQAILYKINCLTTLGRQDEVKALYEKIAGGNQALRFIGIQGLGDLHMAAKEYDAAIKQYEQLLSDKANKDLAHYKIAKACQGKGDDTQAREHLQKVLDTYADVEDGEKPPIHFKVKELMDELDEKGQS